jgi:ZIP family zinc transporter
VSGLGTGTLIALYAISAGLLIYVATGPMMKPLEETSPLRAIGALGAGTAFALVVLALPIHEHGVLGNHDHDHGAVDFRDQQRASEHLH